MNTVTFSFDLGEETATYTGRVVGHIGHTIKVTYYEPTIRDFVSIDLRKDQVLSRGFQETRMLPKQPVVTPNVARPFIAHTVNMPVYA